MPSDRMTIDAYLEKVIELFRDGNPTQEQYAAMADCVLEVSEGDECQRVAPIDAAILGSQKECTECGSFYREREDCWGCGKSCLAEEGAPRA